MSARAAAISFARGGGALHSISRILLASCLAVAAGCGESESDVNNQTPDAGGGGVTCESRAGETVGLHIVAQVSWPQTILAGGNGTLHIWSRAQTTYSGNDLTATVRACGAVVPPLTMLPQYGGYKIQPLFPDALWDSSSMPSFTVAGTHGGFQGGAKVELDEVAVLIGATMADPANGPWPTNGTELQTLDHDGNGKPGVDAISRTGGEFRMPPANLDALSTMGASGVFADVLYLAFRVVTAIDGTRQGCDRVTGTATLSHFDNHVVGCHASVGRECEPGEVNLLDLGRSIFQVSAASFEMVHLPDGATCADVRAALPQ
jgi:hypothetical protein